MCALRPPRCRISLARLPWLHRSREHGIREHATIRFSDVDHSQRPMATLPILRYPDPRLRTKAKPVASVDGAVTRLIDNLLETMYAENGIGLAATQVNIHKRVLVVDVSERRNEPLAFVNPVIEATAGEQQRDEGCLSVPGFAATVKRAESIRVSATNRAGKPFELEAEGLLALCIQHECDHLEGKLFVDYLSRLKRQRIESKLRKQARADKA